MAGVCPKCGRTLIGAGVCPAGDYRASTVTKAKPAPAASTSGSTPTPSAYTPPAPVPSPSSSSYSPPVTSSYSPPPIQPVAQVSSPTQGVFGAIRLRGSIEEVGAARFETVSMAARNAMGNAAVGAVTAIPRAIGIILAVLFAPLRMLLVPSLMGGRQRRNRADELQVPINPFVLKGEDGTEYDCTLRGEVRGGFLKLGESVEVVGRVDRTRVIQVNSVRSLRTGAVTQGWVDPRARMARVHAVAGVVFLIAMLILLLSIFSAFAVH